MNGFGPDEDGALIARTNLDAKSTAAFTRRKKANDFVEDKEKGDSDPLDSQKDRFIDILHRKTYLELELKKITRNFKKYILNGKGINSDKIPDFEVSVKFSVL